MTRRFIESVKRAPISPSLEKGWLTIGNYLERADWVNQQMLYELLPAQAFRLRVNAYADEHRGRRSRAILRCASRFVAVVDDQEQFVQLVNRQVYLDDVAATLEEEPLS